MHILELSRKRIIADLSPYVKQSTKRMRRICKGDAAMTASVQGTHDDVESGRSNFPAPLNVRSKGNSIKSSVSKQVDELRFHGLMEMLNRVRRRSM